MAILDAMQSAAIRLVGRRPGAFFGATGSNLFEQEICDLINEAAKDIAQSHDWRVLTRVALFVGDGVRTTFPFPADYSRQLVVTDIADKDSWLWGYTHIPSVNEFLIIKNSRISFIQPGMWTIYGNEFHFWPAPDTAREAQFPYITKNIGTLQGNGTEISSYTRDDDVSYFPDRLLTLWLVWRWRENKKLDFSGDQEAFLKAMDEYASKDAGSKVIRLGLDRAFRNLPVAWPWALG